MKGISSMLLVAAYILLSVAAFATDKETIKKHVDTVVSAINNGYPATDYGADAYNPYVFIMDADGRLIVHPHLAGEYLQEKAAPIYKALRQATTDGTWVTYIWKGAPKETYVRRTNDNLTVGSGN
jgi:signal transduction histidine kinase